MALQQMTRQCMSMPVRVTLTTDPTTRLLSSTFPINQLMLEVHYVDTTLACSKTVEIFNPVAISIISIVG